MRGVKGRAAAWLDLAALAAAAAALVIDPGTRLLLGHVLGPRALSGARAYVRHLGPWGPVGLIGLLLLHGVAFIPAEVLTLATLWLYGPVWGLVYAWLGSMLSAYAAFYLAPPVGRPLVERYVPAAQLERLDRLIAEQGARGLFVLRLVPWSRSMP